MAWVLGANSNSPPFAPAIGANAISTMRAAFVIGLLAAAGALMQGGSISETVGADLIDGVAITPLAATAGLLTAATFMAVGIYTRYPIPAAFATTGAMVGVGLSLGGDPAFDTYQRLGTFWLLVPIMSGGLAYDGGRPASRRRSRVGRRPAVSWRRRHHRRERPTGRHSGPDGRPGNYREVLLGSSAAARRSSPTSTSEPCS